MPLQDAAELLWQFRTNAGVISGRLKREPFFSYIELLSAFLTDVNTIKSFAPRCCLWRLGVSMGEQEESLTIIEKVFKYCNPI